MVPRFFILVALVCCACAREQIHPLPLVPESLAPSLKARPDPTAFKTKTIGVDRYSVGRSRGESTESSVSRTAADPWSPVPVYGNKNPNPPGPGTPLFGDMNPSPSGPSTPRYGDLNPSPPGPSTPRYGDLNPSPP